MVAQGRSLPPILASVYPPLVLKIWVVTILRGLGIVCFFGTRLKVYNGGQSGSVEYTEKCFP
ncbi:MAG: hypothetical protein LBJ00_02970 [Planctomycetaceae bacterium]|nr:hypothetical protein [Planctomycetaceae bacterium]